MPLEKGSYWFRIIAEGVVIVVSILLAFGIDAWWDDRQLRHEERALLEELRATLSEDILDVSQAADTLSTVNDGLKSLARLVEGGEPMDSVDPAYQQGLRSLRRFTYVKLRYGPYETLKDRGLHLITNDDLRTRLTSLYDNRLPTIMQNNELDISLTRNEILPRILDQFELDADGNWGARGSTGEARSVALTLARHRSDVLEYFVLPSYRTALTLMQETVDAIDSELAAG